MLTKLLNIALIFSVLTVLSGSTICASHCDMQRKTVSNCCSIPQENDDASCCITPAGTFALSTEKYLLPDYSYSGYIPLFFEETFIFSFKPTVFSFEFRWFNYKSPLITKDLSLLNEVFRI